jgi:hypothetical protein
MLPEMIRARSEIRTLRIWCAAASTGQEPFSIAMILKEHFPQLSGWDVRIFATDINGTGLDRARTGVFRQIEVNRGLPALMLVKYFEKAGLDWQLKPEIRKMVSFQELNLLDRWPLFGPQDIVFMRNVLIYFDVEDELVSERTNGPTLVYRQRPRGATRAAVWASTPARSATATDSFRSRERSLAPTNRKDSWDSAHETAQRRRALLRSCRLA